VLAVLVFYCKINEHNIQYAFGFVMIDAGCMLYFVLRTFIVKKNIEKNNAVIGEYSKKILQRHTAILILYIVLNIVITVFIVYTKVAYGENVEIWKWYAVQLPMMYSDARYLSSIVAIGKHSYCSGD
jgi:hypothetical protein